MITDAREWIAKVLFFLALAVAPSYLRDYIVEAVSEKVDRDHAALMRARLPRP